MSATLESTTSADEALSYLAARLDLANVRMKLEDTEEGKGFTPEESALAEAEYRRFLALHVMFPDADIVPCHIVDDIWHQHILDTIAYREDCQAIFGRFLDHFPYFGMRGEDDAKDLYNAYEDTLVKYEAAFGAPPDGTWRAPDAKAKVPQQARWSDMPDAVQATEVSVTSRLPAGPPARDPNRA